MTSPDPTPAREIRPVTFGEDPHDKLFDFRPRPVDLEVPDPKASPAVESADSSVTDADLIPVAEDETTTPESEQEVKEEEKTPTPPIETTTPTPPTPPSTTSLPRPLVRPASAAKATPQSSTPPEL